MYEAYVLPNAVKTLTFFIILNLKFLDQLERRHCKDTPFFRPFYIGAPKGPFLPGLKGLSHEIDFKNFDKKLHNLA